MSLRRVLMIAGMYRHPGGDRRPPRSKRALVFPRAARHRPRTISFPSRARSRCPINLWGYVRNPGTVRGADFHGSGPAALLCRRAAGRSRSRSVKISRVVRREDGIRTVEFTVNLASSGQAGRQSAWPGTRRHDLCRLSEFCVERCLQYPDHGGDHSASIANAMIATRGL